MPLLAWLLEDYCLITLRLVLKCLHCLPVRQRKQYKIAMLVQKCLNGRVPQYVIDDCRCMGWWSPIRDTECWLAVKFWKSSGTTQPLVTGHSLLLYQVFGTSSPSV